MKYSVYQVTREARLAMAPASPFLYGMGEFYTKEMVAGYMMDGSYELVATIEADDLEQVFEIGNIGPEDKINRIADRMASISVGDVIIDENDERYIVAPEGFDLLVNEPEEV